MDRYSYVVSGKIQRTNIAFPATVAGVYYSSAKALPSNFYPQVDLMSAYDPLTEQLYVTDHVIDGVNVNVIYTASPRSVEDIAADKHRVMTAIEAHHDVISKQPVTVDGIDYKGGWESATVIKGCADTVQELGGTTCAIVNTVGAEQTLTIAETRAVAVGISLAYQATFAAKTAALIAVAGASNETELNAALTTFVAANPA